MMAVHVLNILDVSKTTANPHGGRVCLSYLRFPSNCSGGKNKWYRYPNPCSLFSKRLGVFFLGILGIADGSATRAGFSRPRCVNLTMNNLGGGLT